jgi:LIVCS family branched-chain amino acid:cation transporter
MIGSKPGFLLTSLLLSVWIPLGAAPRCIVLSHASLAAYTTHAPALWVFSLVYSIAVFIVIFGKFKLLDLLGKWIVLPFLACLGIIFLSTVWTFGLPVLEAPRDLNFFVQGVLEGYNTMDMIASFFFSATIIHMLAKEGDSVSSRFRPMLTASAVVTLLLGSVYMILMVAAASGSSSLAGIEPKSLLSYLSLQALGSTWSIVAIAAIILACFSTSLALIIAYADFLHSCFFTKEKGYFWAVIFSLVLTFATSLIDLGGITAITAPVLRVCYPLLILMTVVDLGLRAWKKRQEALS